MRILIVNEDRTVVEVDSELVDLTEEDLDAVMVGDHDVWVVDGALFGDAPVAHIGGHPVTLPAYITGRSGESEGPATMTVEELERLIG